MRCIFTTKLQCEQQHLMPRAQEDRLLTLITKDSMVWIPFYAQPLHTYGNRPLWCHLSTAFHDNNVWLYGSVDFTRNQKMVIGRITPNKCEIVPFYRNLRVMLWIHGSYSYQLHQPPPQTLNQPPIQHKYHLEHDIYMYVVHSTSLYCIILCLYILSFLILQSNRHS